MSDSDNGKKKNLYAIRYGNSDGELRFGHVTGDNEITAVLLRSGYFHDHFISLDGTGEGYRAGGTICRSPGSFQVKAGDTNSDNDQTIFMRAENGDVLISAPTGNIILEGKSILLKASGQGGGVVDIDAAAKVNIHGGSDGVKVTGTGGVSIVSERTLDVIGHTVTNIYGGIIDMADANSCNFISKPSKNGVKGVPGADKLTSLTSQFGLTGLIPGVAKLEDRMKLFGGG
tara:strand:+ start:1939 stop:2628 length:690 start_codon:yes stop_codon:yes gene_type:complete